MTATKAKRAFFAQSVSEKRHISPSGDSKDGLMTLVLPVNFVFVQGK
jgi:hypothetical protein